MPVVELLAVSTLDDGSRAVEFQYQVDNAAWHPFTASRYLTVKDDFLRLQGRHLISVRARAAGDPESVDAIPAQAEVIIDAQPPRVSVRQTEDGSVAVTARDLVTPDPVVRYRLDQGAWSTWTPASRLTSVPAAGASTITVEASDSEGNVGTVKHFLIRGNFDGTASSCGCTTVGDDRAPAGPALFLLGIGLAGLGARVSRRRPSARDEGAPRAALPAPAPRLPSASPARVARHALGGVAVLAFASLWAGCNCNSNHNASGGTTGGCADCVELQPGLIGEYSSAAVSGSDIWVAGYSEADWDNGNSYGDLVVGKWNGTNVAWNQVDGVPSTPPVDPTVYDVNGFRGGQTAPGPDVGLWTSIVIGGDGNPAVSYYDRTNFALKFAQYDGTSWAVQTVDSTPSGQVGRYSKMIFLNGNFVIAYQSIAPGGTGGALVSKVRVATSTGGTPAAGAWTFQDVATVNTTPCRASFCASTEACVSSTKVCTTTLASSMCTAACTSAQACVMSGGAPTCLAIWDTTHIDSYPDAIGDYITLAPDGQGGFGIAYYDRTNGNLVTARSSGGAWVNTIVDGEGATVPSGDAGIGASLFIDTNGDWHIAYVNGYTEALQYIKITGGKTALTPEIIDNGLGDRRDALHRRAAPRRRRRAPHRARRRRGAGDLRRLDRGRAALRRRHARLDRPHVERAGGHPERLRRRLLQHRRRRRPDPVMNWWRVGGGMVAGRRPPRLSPRDLPPLPGWGERAGGQGLPRPTPPPPACRR